MLIVIVPLVAVSECCGSFKFDLPQRIDIYTLIAIINALLDEF